MIPRRKRAALVRAHTFRPPGEHPVRAFGFARPWPSSSLDDAPHDAVRDAAPRRVRSVSRRSFFAASPSANRGACPDRFCHRDHPRAPPCNTTSTSSGPRRPRPGANASLDDERLRGRAPSPTGCRRLLFRWLASASRGTNVRAEHLPVAPADHRYGDTDDQRASVSLGPKGLAVPPRPAKGRAGVQSPRCRLAFLPSGEGTLPVASLSRARRENQRAFLTPPWLAPTTRVAQRGEGSARPCFRRGRGRSARNGRTCTKGRAARCAANNRGPIWTPPPDFARPKCTKS